MSAPHVAGTVALMLQANPTLDLGHVLDILRSTARHDSFTGPGWTPTFGAGKVDADAAVRAALQAPLLTATPRPPTATPSPSPSATPTPWPTDPPIPPESLAIVGVRVDRHGTSDGWHFGNPPPTERTGTGLDLSVYTRLDNLWSPATLRIVWTVTRDGAPVLSRSRRVSRGILDRGVLWSHLRFTPTRAGRYRFAADVSTGALSDSRSVSFRVAR
jgi:hypothetical protein